MTTYIEPFSIVKASFTDIRGEQSIGLFVIIYVDFRDVDIHYKQNIVGLKVTSNAAFLNKYSFPLSVAKVPFLDKHSWVQCDKPHVLETFTSSSIGLLDVGLRMSIYRKFQEFKWESTKQMLDNIPVRGGN